MFEGYELLLRVIRVRGEERRASCGTGGVEVWRSGHGSHDYL